MLAAYMADELVVSHPPQLAAAASGSRGTVVTLWSRLVRPALLGPAPGARAAAHGGPQFRADIPAAGHAVVCGPADSSTAERPAGRLLAACRGGTISLTADLAAVTQLASAGVWILFQVRDRLGAHRQDLTLTAESGSPAGTVLNLVRLPSTGYRTVC